MFRRRQIPTHLAAAHERFAAQAERIEAARRALLSCLPVGRVDPVPVPVGLDLLSDEIDAVRADLPAWRVPPVEAQWQACNAALNAAQAHIPVARAVAERSGELEELLGAVEDVDEPLGDAWQAAERAWRRLRR